MPHQTAKRPPPTPSGTRYEDDYYTWIHEQVALLRAGRLDEMDAENVAEELSDMGRSERRSLESALAQLALHLLKWDHQPSRRSRSWMASVNKQRRIIGKLLSENPGLRPQLAASIESGYAAGRDDAVSETNLDYDVFPEHCPYPFEEMMERPIVFEPTPRRRKSRG